MGDINVDSGLDSYVASGLDSCEASAICFEAETSLCNATVKGGDAIASARNSTLAAANKSMISQTLRVEPDSERGRCFQAVLMIQMELCTGSTLRSWLDS